MAERTGAEQMLEFWKRQMEEGTKAWLEAIGRGESADPSRLWRPFVDQSIASWATVMGQGPVSPELMTQWKQFLDQWIAAWGEALERAMHSEAFARALGQSLDQWVNTQAPVRKAAAEVSTTALEALGLPSRADLESLSRLLTDLDDRLERVDDQVQAIAARLAASRPSAAASRPRPGTAAAPSHRRAAAAPSHRRAAPSASRKRRRR